MQCGGDSHEAQLAAVVEIQRFWRGFRTRLGNICGVDKPTYGNVNATF